MRLTDHERAVIREAVERHFGPETQVRVFGSRVRDDALGGDIDIFLDGVDAAPEEVVRRKIALLLELHSRLGDQRVDVVVRRRSGPELPIHRQAEATGVLL